MDTVGDAVMFAPDVYLYNTTVFSLKYVYHSEEELQCLHLRCADKACIIVIVGQTPCILEEACLLLYLLFVPGGAVRVPRGPGRGIVCTAGMINTAGGPVFMLQNTQ